MKNILLLIAFLSITFSSYSQHSKNSREAKESKYGVRVGINVSNLDFNPAPVSENLHRNGFAFGFYGEYFLSNKVSLVPEIQYSAEGSKDEEFRVDYLQMPIIFRLNFSEKFSMGIGPQVGLKIYEYEDGYKNFAFSGIGGLEFMISEKFFLDARYSIGFLNILDDNSSDLKAINSNFQFGLGLKI